VHQIIGEERQLDDIFMHFVKNRDIFAQERQHIILLNFCERWRKLDKTEKVVEDVDHRVSIIVNLVQNADRPLKIARFQFLDEVLELHIGNIGAQLLHKGEVGGFVQDANFFKVVNKNTDRVVADIQQKLFGGGFDRQILFLDNFVHGGYQIVANNLVHFQNVEPRLQALVHLLDICADGNKHDIF
jgi:hypothetical protein